MITHKQLISIDYTPDKKDTKLYCMFGSWEYGFDIVRQELIFLNDGVGEPVVLCRVTDFKELKELLDLYNNL